MSTNPKPVKYVYIPATGGKQVPDSLAAFCLKLTQYKANGLEPLVVDVKEREAIFIVDEDVLIELKNKKEAEVPAAAKESPPTEDFQVIDFAAASKIVAKETPPPAA